MKIISILILVATAGSVYGQDKFLDVEKYAPCELFAQKSGYDWQQRISQIDSIENKEVTVFEIKPKDNQIKFSYSGHVEIPGKNSGKQRQKGDATVITVVVDEKGQRTAYFPLTNNKRYRIYLSSCLN